MIILICFIHSLVEKKSINSVICCTSVWTSFAKLADDLFGTSKYYNQHNFFSLYFIESFISNTLHAMDLYPSRVVFFRSFKIY